MPELKTRYRVREIGLFGSLARGSAHEASDVDLVAEFDEAADLFDLIGLSLYLEDRLGRPVDVVPKNAIRKELAQTILDETLPV